VVYDRHDMTTCAKCGTENVAGDAFCGNCGAFLEFAAEEAAEDAQVGGAAQGGELEAPAKAVAMNPPPPGPPPVPVQVAAAAPPVALVSPAPSGPTCSACGRLNPTGRRFCISCGERLPAASTTVAQGPGSGPRPSAATSTPAWEFPTAVVPTATVPTATPTAAAPSAASSGGRSRLPLIGGTLVVLALLAGGAVLLLGGGPDGSTPETTATARPSSALASATPGTEPSAEPTAAAETPAATGAPTIQPQPPTPPATVPPGPSVGIAIRAAKASSQLKADRGPKFLFDGSPATTWKSASGKFQGAWVEVRFAPAAITRLQVWTGWQKSEPLFYGNHRPQNVTVSFDGGDPVPLELRDALGAQRIDIPPQLGIVRATRVRITIADVYAARKTAAADSPTKEVAISEIRLYGIPVTP